ncbi:transposable element Tcb2 transposase [Trichonephila clavipes]|nr:transposable element Tcb2 transposase [Trichonephila clavipes]
MPSSRLEPVPFGTEPTASSTAIQAQVAPSVGVPVSSRTIRTRLDQGHLGWRHSLRVLPLTPTHRCLLLKWCRARRNWTAAEWNQVVFRDESGLNLSNDDNRVRVWRPRGELLNPVHLFYSGTSLIQLLRWTATAGSDVVQSRRPIFNDFFQHLWPHIGNNTANVVFQLSSVCGLSE